MGVGRCPLSLPSSLQALWSCPRAHGAEGDPRMRAFRFHEQDKAWPPRISQERGRNPRELLSAAGGERALGQTGWAEGRAPSHPQTHLALLPAPSRHHVWCDTCLQRSLDSLDNNPPLAINSGKVFFLKGLKSIPCQGNF